MKIAYQILNWISGILTFLALLALCFSIPPALASLFPGCPYAGNSFVVYLALAAVSTVICVIAIIVRGFDPCRFPYYCIMMSWAPLALLAILGVVLTETGKLYW